MEKDVIDMKDVMERVQDDRGLLMELLEIFETDFLEKRALFDELIKEGEFDRIKDIAHSLKGATGNISAKIMHASCERLERLAGAKDAASIQELIALLDEQFLELQSYIDRLKKEG